MLFHVATFFIILLTVPSFAHAQASVSRVKSYHPHHLFIKMNPGRALIQDSQILNSKKLTDSLYLVTASNPLDLEKRLKNDSDIAYTQKDFFAPKKTFPQIQKNKLAGSIDVLGLDQFSRGLFDQEKNQTSETPLFNDPSFNKQWALTGAKGMKLPQTLKMAPAVQPTDIVVAVIDTGVDYRHEDLKDMMWVNTQEIPNDGIDNDQNGYIDDVYGINLLDSELNRTGPENNPMASHYHGTHVAGIIGAKQNNSIGVAGVTNNVKIMAIRAVPDDGDELDSNVALALVYAAKNGARIINCSFGKNENEGGMIVRDVIAEIGEKYGVLVIVSAGNDSKGDWDDWHDNDKAFKYPASFENENMLVVASTTESGGLSDFSNIGLASVDIAAPGSDIYSTLPKNHYGMLSGTSMAAPNVTGAAALILSYYPTKTAIEIKKLLMDTVTPVASFKTKLASGGRINLKSALEEAHKAK